MPVDLQDEPTELRAEMTFPHVQLGNFAFIVQTVLWLRFMDDNLGNR